MYHKRSAVVNFVDDRRGFVRMVSDVHCNVGGAET